MFLRYVVTLESLDQRKDVLHALLSERIIAYGYRHPKCASDAMPDCDAIFLPKYEFSMLVNSFTPKVSLSIKDKEGTGGAIIGVSFCLMKGISIFLLILLIIMAIMQVAFIVLCLLGKLSDNILVVIPAILAVFMFSMSLIGLRVSSNQVLREISEIPAIKLTEKMKLTTKNKS